MAQEKLQKRYHKADVFLGLLSGKPAFLTGEKKIVLHYVSESDLTLTHL